MGDSSFLHIKVCDSDPFKRGMQYGQQAAELIYRGIEGYKRHFGKSMGQSWEDIVEKSSLYVPFTQKYYPEELEEMRGIAKGSGVSENEIMALNCRYEILKLKAHECTTATVLCDASADGKVYLIQNWDYRPWVENHAVIVDIDDMMGTRIIGVTEAGQLVRNGMNNKGIGVCANNLTSTYDTGEIGAPVTFVRRRALNCGSFDELVNTVESAQRGVSCNYMLASAENMAVDLETTPGEVFRVVPQNDIITHANHMVVGHSVCTNNGKKFRDKILRRVLEDSYGDISLDKIMKALRNHERFPGSSDTYPESNCIEAVCSHVPYGNIDEDKVWKTIASSIYNLTDGIAYICKGCPCENEYVKFEL